MKKIILLSLFISLVTFAQSDDGGGDDNGAEKPCKSDREKFCKDVKPGQGRIIKCLKEKEAELSPACKTHFETKVNQVRENHSKCKDDRKKFCKDVKPGEGRIIKCLKEKEAELSPACKEVMANKKM